MKPVVGLRFLHARIINQDGSPAICTVSAVRQGCVYYRVGDEAKAKEFCTLERWPMVCKAVLPPKSSGDPSPT